MRLFRFPHLIAILLTLLPAHSHVFGQAAPAAPARPAPPMPSNGGFERASSGDNLWDGVDAAGNLTGFRDSAEILLESGAVGDYPMPASVVAIDMNNDKLTDLVVADPAGYIRLYFNQGTPTEPKFTHGEIVPLWIPFSTSDTNYLYTRYRHRTPIKIALSPMRSPGTNDLVVGNYLGELFFFPNSGSAMAPDFRQPASIDSARVNTASEGKMWANLLAPVVADMNRNGKMDVMVGEGSYSANGIHLLLNEGTNGAPKFSEASRSVIAFGDGKEQLTPTLVDYNGDGFPDLIVGDRRGELSLYLHPGATWKPGMEFPFTSTLQLGTTSRMPGPIAPSAADLNGDGLFDLVIGKTNGRVALAFNTGTAQEPKFAAPVELKGVNVEPLRSRTPVSWGVYNGFIRGNALSRVVCVDETEDPNVEPPEGKFALKAHFLPSLNKIMKPMFFRLDNPKKGNLFGYDFNPNAGFTGNKYVFLSNSSGLPLKTNTSYEVSFDVKGSGVRDGQFGLGWRGHKKLGEAKIERGDRGAANVRRNEAEEKKFSPGTFNVSPNWQRVSRTMRVVLDHKDLKDLEKVSNAVLRIGAELPDPSSVLYIDNVTVVEK